MYEEINGQAQAMNTCSGKALRPYLLFHYLLTPALAIPAALRFPYNLCVAHLSPGRHTP